MSTSDPRPAWPDGEEMRRHIAATSPAVLDAIDVARRSRVLCAIDRAGLADFSDLTEDCTSEADLETLRADLAALTACGVLLERVVVSGSGTEPMWAIDGGVLADARDDMMRRLAARAG